ncbi:MAG: hypothetical protein M1839_002375 [Geoglossum umbratile]|nr:MAG: hypothetical protein M1839_002375 [Geoglossum umbratile]
MASTQRLTRACKARLPTIDFNPNMTAKKVREKWSEQLLVHSQASRALRQDLDVFVKRWPYAQNGLVTQFLISIYHHMAILLMPALQQFKEILKDFHNVEAGKRPFESGEAPTIRELLDYATGGIEGLNDSWGKAMLILGLQEEEYTVSEGDKVPTASPRQLLICLLVNHPVIQEKLEVDGDTALADIGRHLKLPSAPQIDGKRFILKEYVADGAPKMFFVCNHVQTGGRELYVGSNQENWQGLPAIRDIRRADRDRRLETYIPLAENAYDALQQVEQGVTLPSSMDSLDATSRLYETRARAIAEMKRTPHPDFLGRWTETG